MKGFHAFPLRPYRFPLLFHKFWCSQSGSYVLLSPFNCMVRHFMSFPFAKDSLYSASYTPYLFKLTYHWYGTLAEQPYDSIPNFSAADALRITGIGRNEFIDIMNKCRSKVLPKCFVLFLRIFIMMLTICSRWDVRTRQLLLP